MKAYKKISLLLLVMLLTAALCACGVTKSALRFGTAGTGGNYYAYGNVLADLLENEAEIQIDVKATAGSAANLRLLNEGFLQLAIAQSDTLQDASLGEGVFTDGALSAYSAVAGLYIEACQIVVQADSDIYTLTDLVGKRVSVGEADSGVIRNAEELLLTNGMTLDMLGEVHYLSFADSAVAMANGEIDAFFCTASAPTTAVSELAKEQPIRLLSLDERTINQMQNLYGCYTECLIPAETYQGQSEPTVTVGVKAVLLASDQLDDDTVRQIVTTLFDNAAAIQYATNFDTMLQLDMATEDIPISFHPGAAAYFEEHGYPVAVGTTEAVSAVYASQDEN